MSSLPKIVVCGAGLVGARHVAQAAMQAELAAIVDPSADARELAARYAVPHFSDLGESLGKVKPDGVVIATPNHLHAEQAVQCLEAGIPVLIEKPIAGDAVSAARIVETQERTGVPVLIGHHRRHNPIITRAKAIIESGELGDLVAVTGQFWLYKPEDYFDVTWRTQPGAGPLFINCIHDIDLLRHLCGEITEVQAMRSNRQRAHAVEDTLALTLRFAGGALGTFSVSDTVVAPWSWELTSGENSIYSVTPESCYRIGGTQQSLSLPDLHRWSHVGPRSWWSDMAATPIETPMMDAFVAQFTHFLKVIGGALPLVSAQEGQASLAVVLQALRADFT